MLELSVGIFAIATFFALVWAIMTIPAVACIFAALIGLFLAYVLGGIILDF